MKRKLIAAAVLLLGLTTGVSLAGGNTSCGSFMVNDYWKNLDGDLIKSNLDGDIIDEDGEVSTDPADAILEDMRYYPNVLTEIRVPRTNFDQTRATVLFDIANTYKSSGYSTENAFTHLEIYPFATASSGLYSEIGFNGNFGGVKQNADLTDCYGDFRYSAVHTECSDQWKYRNICFELEYQEYDKDVSMGLNIEYVYFGYRNKNSQLSSDPAVTDPSMFAQSIFGVLYNKRNYGEDVDDPNDRIYGSKLRILPDRDTRRYSDGGEIVRTFAAKDIGELTTPATKDEIQYYYNDNYAAHNLRDFTFNRAARSVRLKSYKYGKGPGYAVFYNEKDYQGNRFVVLCDQDLELDVTQSNLSSDKIVNYGGRENWISSIQIVGTCGLTLYKKDLSVDSNHRIAINESVADLDDYQFGDDTSVDDHVTAFVVTSTTTDQYPKGGSTSTVFKTSATDSNIGSKEDYDLVVSVDFPNYETQKRYWRFDNNETDEKNIIALPTLAADEVNAHNRITKVWAQANVLVVLFNDADYKGDFRIIGGRSGLGEYDMSEYNFNKKAGSLIAIKYDHRSDVPGIATFYKKADYSDDRYSVLCERGKNDDIANGNLTLNSILAIANAGEVYKGSNSSLDLRDVFKASLDLSDLQMRGHDGSVSSVKIQGTCDLDLYSGHTQNGNKSKTGVTSSNSGFGDYFNNEMSSIKVH